MGAFGGSSGGVDMLATRGKSYSSVYIYLKASPLPPAPRLDQCIGGWRHSSKQQGSKQASRHATMLDKVANKIPGGAG